MAKVDDLIARINDAADELDIWKRWSVKQSGQDRREAEMEVLLREVATTLSEVCMATSDSVLDLSALDALVQKAQSGLLPGWPWEQLCEALPILIAAYRERDALLRQGKVRTVCLRCFEEMSKDQTVGFETCQDCGKDYDGWYAPNSVWNKVMGNDGGFICTDCFNKRADTIFA